MNKKSVAVLGATGMVGQRFIQALVNHPYFEISVLAASPKSAGKKYSESAKWYLEGGMPEEVKGMKVVSTEARIEADIAFSCLPSESASEIELRLAKQGAAVISTSSNFRYDDDVPVIIPEVNIEHVGLLLEGQRKRRGFEKGFIVKKPNCTTTGLVMTLKPLQDKFGIESVIMTSMQALSGAGYEGVPSMAIVDNVIPYIGGEEEKVEKEVLKLLGNGRKDAKMKVSCSCNRVGVTDGHLESAFVKLGRKASVGEVKRVMREFEGEVQKMKLPSAPIPPLIVMEELDRPQPRMDRYAGEPERAGGMA
ncbi:aspartate-semialdehyde dehydrogenase, partial [Candidatus Micrarchaeota archaeon CG11_big_fil_rev_8_21_14_0_20_47_5]